MHRRVELDLTVTNVILGVNCAPIFTYSVHLATPQHSMEHMTVFIMSSFTIQIHFNTIQPASQHAWAEDGYLKWKILKVFPFGTMYHFGTITNLMPTFFYFVKISRHPAKKPAKTPTTEQITTNKHIQTHNFPTNFLEETPLKRQPPPQIIAIPPELTSLS